MMWSSEVIFWQPFLWLLLPFFGAILLFLVGDNMTASGGRLAIIFLGLNLIFSILSTLSFWTKPIALNIHWFVIADWTFWGGLLLDHPALLMGLLVSSISLVVAWFSQAYMEGQPRMHLYWAYLLLFVGAMQGIVLSSNLLWVFVCWELVGLSSYLLIGFFREKDTAARASQKAFLVNRIADILFFSGLLMVFIEHQSLEWTSLWAETSYSSWSTGISLPLGPLLIALGAIGKSAQFPLQTWLPDAMEGPTPVSSLIHAATMVAAGVYLLFRMFPLLDEQSLLLFALVGGITSLMAAISALQQWDIKRVLAYSTISQLGYMFIGVGVGARDMAFFHLFTHAFFKCALFLVAATIIHVMHRDSHQSDIRGIPYEQDMRNMGGLRKRNPLLFVLYLIPMLSLAGLPFFSGFLSKDGIILASISHAQQAGGLHWFIPLTALLTAFLTAWYIMRQMVLVFEGEFRGMEEIGAKGNGKFLLPISFLMPACLWLAFSWNPLDGHHSWLLESIGTTDVVHPNQQEIWMVTIILLALGGMGIAWLSVRKRISSGLLETPQSVFQQMMYHHFFLDALYEQLIAPMMLAFGRLMSRLNLKGVDGIVNAIGKLVIHSPVEKEAEAKRGSMFGGMRLSLASLVAWMDRGVIDGLIHSLVGFLQGLGKSASDTQKQQTQRYFIGLVLGLILILAVVFLWS
ncbi:MAG: NADH-quinone oxidoreductase subunit L [Bacteroidota bacterium]